MTEEATYQSLLAIRARKLQLKKEIEGSEKVLKGHWDTIFHQKKSTMPKTPTQKFMSIAGNSMGVIDGAILGWKLYRKLKKK